MQNLIFRGKEFLQQSFRVQGKNLGWINLARGLIIIMVVYRHAIEGIRNAGMDLSEYRYLEVLVNMMFTFRMPLFFVISGILMNLSIARIGHKEYIKKRAQYILYPYVIWAVIQVSLQLLLPQFVNNKASWKTYLSILYNPGAIEQFWYLYALFNIMLLYSTLKIRLGISWKSNMLLGLAFFLIAQFCFKNGINLYFLYDIFTHYIFFALGNGLSDFILDPKKANQLLKKNVLYATTVIFLITHFYYLKHPEVLRSPLILIIASSGILTALTLTMSLQNRKELKFIKVLGANSLYIYLMHVMIMAGNRALLTKFLHINSVPIVLITNITLGIIIPIVLYNLFIKAGLWWLFSPVKPASTESNLPDKTSIPKLQTNES